MKRPRRSHHRLSPPLPLATLALLLWATPAAAALHLGPETLVEASGAPIDLPGSARSRPFACDWTGDGRIDLLVGGSDGCVHRFQGIREPGVDGRNRRVPGAIAP